MVCHSSDRQSPLVAPGYSLKGQRPLGRYCLTGPVAFSLVLLCKGLCGSQKHTAEEAQQGRDGFKQGLSNDQFGSRTGKLSTPLIALLGKVATVAGAGLIASKFADDG